MKEIKLTQKQINYLYERLVTESKKNNYIVEVSPTMGIYIDNKFYSLDSLIIGLNERAKKHNVKYIK